MPSISRPHPARPMLLACCLLALSLLPAAALAEDQGWRAELKTKVFFNSHTSYEFGNPDPPNQSPLSRLEFPLDSVWTGVELRKRVGRVSMGVEFLTSMADQESGRFKDSDWAEDSAPDKLSDYGETDCRVRPSFQLGTDLDVEVADEVGMPSAFSLRPLLGFRWQRLRFMAHDGKQFGYSPEGNITYEMPLPGNVISFRQDWYQTFLGARLGYEWRELPLLHRLELTSQLDWGLALGRNKDLHLLRGDRATKDRTTGSAWHMALGVNFGLTESLDLGVEAEYLNIESTGRHKMSHGQFTESWSDGVRVWSEQMSYTVNLGYRF